MKILVADDVGENLYLLEALLKGHGYEVVTARRGEEAMERLREGGVDLVVSDILMPGMDGYMLCRAIRADDTLKGVPFVFYSATYTDPKDIELGLSLGADRYLVKPMEPDAILVALQEVMAARAASPGGTPYPTTEEMDFLRRHNEALFRKLEAKMAALERANRDLEREMKTRERTEEQLRQSQKMEALGTLAGGVAHDFNNQLTVIMNCASLLKMKTGLDADAVSLVDEIAGAVDRAADLTRSLLTFSRRQETKLVPGDLNAVVSELERSLRRLLPGSIDFRFSRHDGAVPVLLDRGLIEQVIVNLAINARDAMPSGGVLSLATSVVRVPAGGGPGMLDGLAPGGYGRLTVSDTGCGMDRETQKRIFEPFFTTKAEGKGTGLGLSIAYGIVSRHGGSLDVRSEKGRGTTFTVYLPLTGGLGAQDARG